VSGRASIGGLLCEGAAARRSFTWSKLLASTLPLQLTAD
jgi:hypothetical protein